MSLHVNIDLACFARTVVYTVQVRYDLDCPILTRKRNRVYIHCELTARPRVRTSWNFAKPQAVEVVCTLGENSEYDLCRKILNCKCIRSLSTGGRHHLKPSNAIMTLPATLTHRPQPSYISPYHHPRRATITRITAQHLWSRHPPPAIGQSRRGARGRRGRTSSSAWRRERGAPREGIGSRC